MTTQNIIGARGGDASVSFAYAPAADTDEVLVRFNDEHGLPLLTKSTKTLGGSSDEINIVSGTGYTIKLTDEDLDNLPNSANYVLYKVVDETPVALFGGTVTVTGDKTQQATIEDFIPFQNGSNQRSIVQVDLPLGSVTVTVTNEDDFITFSGFEGTFPMTLPEAATNKGKIFHIKCLAEAPNFQLTIGAINLKVNEEVTLISNGTGYDIWNYKQKTGNNNQGPIVDDAHEVSPLEDVIVANTNAAGKEITINLPADRAQFFGKKITIICTGATVEHNLVVYDISSGNSVRMFEGPGKIELYLVPGTAGGDDWLVLP